MKEISAPRIYISAFKKSSGKTTISIALSKILSRKYKLLTFKKGPDYIDPMWLELASNNPCFNLDFFFLKDRIYSYFVNKIDQSKCNFFLIEGNHGLFDDIYLDGKTSNASLAKITKTPVIIVVDVSELGRSLVALLKGMVDFDKDVFISGVILNKIQSVRQEKKLIEAIKNYTDLPVLGSLPVQSISITQRHLGLTSTLQEEKKQELIENIASNLENYLDITQITKIASNAPKLYVDDYSVHIRKLKKQVVIAIAFDEAFNFYYKKISILEIR